MGCDIHAVFQKYEGGAWVDVDSKWDQDRHYYLFGWLAGVRLREGATPISGRRGIPLDFEFDVESERHGKVWMGEHSYSWLNATEILASNIDVDYFVDEVRRLVDLHGGVRVVFGFDS